MEFPKLLTAVFMKYKPSTVFFASCAIWPRATNVLGVKLLLGTRGVVLRQSPVLVPTAARGRKFVQDRRALRLESRLRMLVSRLVLKSHQEFCARCRQRCRGAVD